MNLLTACTHILDQLADLMRDIDAGDYSRASTVLSGSSVGQHMRHTLEFFICFEQGYQHGTINYDKRNHDKLIETDKDFALNAILRIKNALPDVDLNKTLLLEVNYNLHLDETESLQTTAKRELIYNIEHAVHHMALIKIGVRDVAPYVTLKKEFGVAASTIRYTENNMAITQ